MYILKYISTNFSHNFCCIFLVKFTLDIYVRFINKKGRINTNLMLLQVTDVSQRNSSSGTSGSASSPSSGISSQLTGSHQQQHTSGQQNNSNSALATAQLLSQQLLMHGALGTQDLQALASTLQHHQLQSLQQQLQQFAMFQANPAAGQLPPFFLQNQVGDKQ